MHSQTKNGSTKKVISDLSDKSNKKEEEMKVFKTLGKLNYSSLSHLEAAFKDDASLSVYSNYIKDNQSLFHDKIVMHLAANCNCIYSILAAQAGAKIVYCVLQGHSVMEERNLFMIEQIIKENKLSGKIIVKLFKDFKIEGKLDVIIGQPMGSNLFFDGMLDRMIEARGLFLDKQKGVLVPDRLLFKSALIWDEYQMDDKLDYWDEVYGVTMREMKKWVQQQPEISTVDPTLIVSDVNPLFDFDLYRISYQQIDEIQRKLSFTPLSPQALRANGLSIWFQAQFTGMDGEKTFIDASPWSQQTKWSHLTLFTRKIWNLEFGVERKFEFLCKKSYVTGNVTAIIKTANQEEVYTIM